MKLKIDEAWKRPLAVFAICFVIASQVVWAQNLGGQQVGGLGAKGKHGYRGAAAARQVETDRDLCQALARGRGGVPAVVPVVARQDAEGAH